MNFALKLAKKRYKSNRRVRYFELFSENISLMLRGNKQRRKAIGYPALKW